MRTVMNHKQGWNGGVHRVWYAKVQGTRFSGMLSRDEVLNVKAAFMTYYFSVHLIKVVKKVPFQSLYFLISCMDYHLLTI